MTTLRHFAGVARSFVAGQATRPELESALAAWENATANVAKRTRKSQPKQGQDSWGRGGYALQQDLTQAPTALDLATNTESHSTTERSEERTSPEVYPRTTWLTPRIAAYASAYGEQPSPRTIARMARVFKEMEKSYPRDEVDRRFSIYCAQTLVRYYSVERFADTWPAWKDERVAMNGGRQDFLAERPGESVDAYIARVGRSTSR